MGPRIGLWHLSRTWSLAPIQRFRGASPASLWHLRAGARTLWQSRHLRGDVDERQSAATVIFVGPSLVLLEADGTRLTFRLDTGSFDPAQPTLVSGWYRTAAGTRVATKLCNGSTTWTFDQQGWLIKSGSG
jgi:hypothetical protein